MRTICYSVAASLDGFVAGPQGEYDWLSSDPDMDMAQLFSRFDTFVMGRGTYDIVLEQGEEGFATFEDHPVYVCSDSLEPKEHPRVEIVRSKDVATRTDAVRNEPGKDIWLFGGGKLFRTFIGAGLVDEVEVAVMPHLLGEGIPLMAGPLLHVNLRLKTHRAYEKSGILMLRYEVLRDESTTAASS